LSASKTLGAYGLLIRSRSIPIFTWTWVTAIGLLVAARGFPPPLTAALLLLSVAGRAICVYTYNDITDVEMDRFNSVKRNRPLPSGKVSVEDALGLVLLSGTIGMVLSLLISFDTFLLSAIWVALFLTYSNQSIRLKRRFLAKESSIAINFIVATLIAGTSVGSISPSVIFSGVFLCFFTLLAAPAAVDTSDIEEDQKFGGKTLAMVLSWKAKIQMIVGFILVVMTLTPLTYVQLGFNVVFPIMVVAVSLLTLRSLVPLANRVEEVAYEGGGSKSFKVLYFFLFVMTLSMAIGAIQI